MNAKNVKPWPHSPGVITRVETHHQRPDSGPSALEVVYKAVIFGKVGYFATYEAAVEFSMQEKRIAAWHDEQLKARPPAFPFYSIADEMGV